MRMDPSKLGNEHEMESVCSQQSEYDDERRNVDGEPPWTQDLCLRAENDPVNQNTFDIFVNQKDSNYEHNFVAKANQYISRLIEDHLADVVSDELAAKPSSEGKDERLVVLAFIQASKEHLEEAHEDFLAFFLGSALVLRQSSGEGYTLATAIDYLFRTVRQLNLSSPFPQIEDDRNEAHVFLRDTLLALIRRSRPTEQQTTTTHISTSDTVYHLYVTLEEEIFKLGIEDILPCFWGTRLDTVCHACGEPFTSTPPIRTFISHDTCSISSAASISIRIINRHLSCLEADKVIFIPVSHVWHEPIRSANATGVHSDHAAKILIDTLAVLLEGAKSSYSQDVEFWHDYLSVPQWQPQTKNILLMFIPAIYSSSNEILIHMADLSHATVARLMHQPALYAAKGEEVRAWNSILPYEEFCDGIAVLPDLADLNASEWISRMWVMLEYYQSKDSYIMDQSGFIWRTETMVGIKHGSFLNLIYGIFVIIEPIASYSLEFTAQFFEKFFHLGRKAKSFCLGEAVNQVRNKQCQLLRDRFFAIHILLKGKRAPEDSRSIPTAETDACVWVWTQAITAGDYSPLFLQHRSASSKTEIVPGVPSWVLGYQDFVDLGWHLGAEQTRAERTPRVENGVVIIPMDAVGIIEDIKFLDLEKSGHVARVDWIIQLLVAAAEVEGVTLSPENFVNGIYRIFPVDHCLRDLSHQQGIGFSLPELQHQEPDLLGKLQLLLDVYSNSSTGDDLEDVAQGIIQLLQLDREILYASNIRGSRLSMTHSVLQSLARQGGKPVDEAPICKIRCSSCGVIMFSCLDLKRSGGIGDTVYRIPGLCYTGTVKEGVGLVVRDGEITGRMLYDPPACTCKIVEDVELV